MKPGNQVETVSLSVCNQICKFQVADAYLTDEDAYYFQRSPQAFDAIFQYYSTGVIHKPSEMCPAYFLSELEFWRIPLTNVGSCCSDVVPKPKEEEKEEEKVTYKSIRN
jgi:hypothetical protein